MKPGCFGSTIAITPFKLPCKTCPYLRDCAITVKKLEPKVLSRIERFDKFPEDSRKSLKARLERYYKRRWKKPNTAPVGQMQETAKREYETLEDRGIDLTDVKRGINPLKDDEPYHVSLACQVAIEESPFKTRDVSDRIMMAGNAKRSSADRMAGRAISMLVAVGAVKMIEKGLYAVCR